MKPSKTLLTVMLVFCASTILRAQTLYYIDSISVSPPAPNTSDPITITVHGNLNMSNAVIASTSHSQLGNNVYLEIDADTSGSGVPMSVPHNESFAIGTLPGGNYTINISGSLMFDSAPLPQHLFSVSGGGGWICDSLAITVLQYAAFSDELIWVLLQNNSMGQLNDQCVYLLDQSGDTLAGQTVFAFPIVPGTIGFYLEVYPGATMPVGIFNGTLAISSGLCAVQQCELPWSGNLCPQQPCTHMTLMIEPTNTATYPFAVPWQLIDGDLVNLASGTMQFAGFAYITTDTFCLAPGTYSFITDPTMTPDSTVIAYAVAENFGGIATVWNVNDGNPDTIKFTLYEACIDSANAIGEPTIASVPWITVDDDMLYATGPANESLGVLRLLTTDGRMVRQVRTVSDRVSVPIADLAPGVYLLHCVPTGQAVRVFVH